jgi:hypothetical protein
VSRSCSVVWNSHARQAARACLSVGANVVRTQSREAVASPISGFSCAEVTLNAGRKPHVLREPGESHVVDGLGNELDAIVAEIHGSACVRDGGD